MVTEPAKRLSNKKDEIDIQYSKNEKKLNIYFLLPKKQLSFGLNLTGLSSILKKLNENFSGVKKAASENTEKLSVPANKNAERAFNTHSKEITKKISRLESIMKTDLPQGKMSDELAKEITYEIEEIVRRMGLIEANFKDARILMATENFDELLATNNRGILIALDEDLPRSLSKEHITIIGDQAYSPKIETSPGVKSKTDNNGLMVVEAAKVVKVVDETPFLYKAVDLENIPFELRSDFNLALSQRRFQDAIWYLKENGQHTEALKLQKAIEDELTNGEVILRQPLGMGTTSEFDPDASALVYYSSGLVAVEKRPPKVSIIDKNGEYLEGEGLIDAIMNSRENVFGSRAAYLIDDYLGLNVSPIVTLSKNSDGIPVSRQLFVRGADGADFYGKLNISKNYLISDIRNKTSDQLTFDQNALPIKIFPSNYQILRILAGDLDKPIAENTLISFGKSNNGEHTVVAIDAGLGGKSKDYYPTTTDGFGKPDYIGENYEVNFWRSYVRFAEDATHPNRDASKIEVLKSEINFSPQQEARLFKLGENNGEKIKALMNGLPKELIEGYIHRTAYINTVNKSIAK